MKRLLFVSAMVVALVMALVVAIQVSASPVATNVRSEARDVAGPGNIAATVPGTVAVELVPTYTLAAAEDAILVEVWVNPLEEDVVVGVSAYVDYDDSFLDASIDSQNDAWLWLPGPSCSGGTCSMEPGGNVTTRTWLATIEFEVLPDAGGQSDIVFDEEQTVVNAAPADTYETVLFQNSMVVVPVEQILNVNVAPQGAVDNGCSVSESSADGKPYMTGEEVELDAQDCTCWGFDHWEGAPLEGSTDDPATITMNDDYTVTAVYTAEQYTVDVNVVGNGTVEPTVGEHTVNCGADFVITATADAGARFMEWGGDLAGVTDNPATLSNIQSNKMITATFVDTYTVDFDSDPDGGTVGVEDENGDGIYDDGETITVTATPDYCYEFAGWTDDLAGQSNPASVVLDSDLSFTATFTVMTSTLSVNVAPMDADARVGITPEQTVFNCGDTVTATAVMTAPWSFDQWTGALTSSDNPDSFVIGEDATTVLTGHFLSTYLVTLPTTDTVDGGTYDAEFDPEDCTDNGDGEYECDPNAVITFTATADTCYDFDVWTGDVPSGHEEDNPLVLTVQANMAVTPTFTLIQFDTLTVTVEPAGMGNTAMVEPTSGPYICGQTMVTATATATDTWSFNAWSGAVESTDNPVTFTMGEEQTLTATFKQYKIYLPLVVRNAE